MHGWQKALLLLLGSLLGAGLGYHQARSRPRWRQVRVSLPPNTQRLLVWAHHDDAICAETAQGQVYCLALPWDWERRGPSTLTWQAVPREETQRTPNTCNANLTPPDWGLPPPPPRPARQILATEVCFYEASRFTWFAWLEDGTLWRWRYAPGEPIGQMARMALGCLTGLGLGFLVALAVVLMLPGPEEHP